MALIRISEYRQLYFEGTPPDPRTIIAQIQRGEIHGRKLGGLWYVDPDRQPQPVAVDLNRDPRGMKPEELHPLARKVLENT
jgi:hypothetical protein